MKTLDRIMKARIKLLFTHPFFGTLATRLENRITVDPRINTAATDGKSILWNEAWVATLSDPELLGVMVHEVLHVANGHAWRRDSRRMDAWNIACDLAINHIIKDAGIILPKEGCFPTQNQLNKSAEMLYDPTQVLAPGKGRGGEGDPGGCGGVMDALPEEMKELEQDWKVAVQQAATAAKLQGKLPAGVERMIEEIMAPKVPWATVLRDFITQTVKNDFNWNRPNTRYSSTDLILPTMISDELPPVVIAVDTSGSIGNDILSQFAAEISCVLSAYETTIHVIYVDAEVAGEQELTRADLPLKLYPKGGGGTDFKPAFDWVGKKDITPACLVYLTDMYGDFPDHAPEYPVLWVSISDVVKAPFGDVVKIELEKR